MNNMIDTTGSVSKEINSLTGPFKLLAASSSVIHMDHDKATISPNGKLIWDCLGIV